MSDPLYPGLQSNLVYGIETTVEETRMVDGECVVVSQHDTRRTYESPTAPLGAPAYTTVCDHVTSTYSGRQPYLVSAAANQNAANMHMPSPMNQSNFTPYMNATQGFNNTTHTPMPCSYVQPNGPAQTQYNHFSPMFNSTAYSQNAYQPNQSFAPPFMHYNTTQFNQPNVDFSSQFPNSTSPNTFSFQPNQTFGHIENQICCPCIKDLMDQITLNTMGNAFQSSQPTPVNYNVFLVNQDHQTHTTDEPMITNSSSDDNVGSCSCMCIQDGARSRSTSTSDLTAGERWDKRDPCATSSLSTWPPEVGTQRDRPEAATEGAKGTGAADTKTDEAPANKTETEKIIAEKLEEAEEEDDETTITQEIIASLLNDILPPHEDGKEAEKKEVSENNGTKTDGGKQCPKHQTAVKDASTCGCKPRAAPHANTPGNNLGHRHGRAACGCARANKKVTFAEAGAGSDVTSTMDFLQFETEMNSWYIELEESERVFINQAEETIRRDAQNFKTRDELTVLAELLTAEVNATIQIERDLENVNMLREEVGAFIGCLENYYDAFQDAAPHSARTCMQVYSCTIAFRKYGTHH